MLTIDPQAISTPDLHQYLVSVVAPRPIAFVSTLDEAGRPNLAPYSFFNAFSSNPPICVFSSNRRVKNNTTKDTLHNVEATGECVINVVTYSIVRQAAVASIEFPAEVNEFERSGLTPLASELVKPFRVAESPVQMECKVRQILPLGDQGGAGNLVICEILRLHISESILDELGRVDPHKLDLMGRMGRAFYVRASGEAIHHIFQDQRPDHAGIGYQALPESARGSAVLTGNNLGRLAGMAAAPTDWQSLRQDETVRQLLATNHPREELHRYAQRELAKENIELAARLVWLAEELGA